jgi:hypothetical protein
LCPIIRKYGEDDEVLLLEEQLKDNKFRNTEIIPKSFSNKLHYQEYLKYIIKNI